MKRLVVLRAAFVLAVTALAVLIAHSFGHSIDHRAEADYSRNVRRLKVVNARLNEEVLRSRSGLAQHYDGLVRHVRELEQLGRTLASVPDFLAPEAGASLKRELAASSRAVGAKRELIEQFKMRNSVLRNSLRFLPILVVRAKAESEKRRVGASAVVAAQALVSAVLLLDVAPDREGHERLVTGIGELERLLEGLDDAVLSRDLVLTAKHAKIVAEHKPAVDRLVRQILEAPIAPNLMKLEDSYAAGYRSALDSAANRETAFFGLGALIVILGLTEVLLRIQRSNAALASATRELREANEALAREHERERELGELKTRFVSMASHEFRTPLSAILSSSELLATYGVGWDRERTLSHLERIRRSAQSMSEMIDEVLLIGRAEAGALRPQPEPVNLEAVCRGLIGTLEQTFGGSHTVRFAFSGEKEVRLDERLVTHVLSNLLENAAKYSSQGSEIVLEAAVRDDECRFVVRDRGIGIAEGDLSRLFQSFERGRNVGHVNGTGLGLAIVRRVLDAQGGSIAVKSELGRGSEFTVTLPLRAESAARTAESV